MDATIQSFCVFVCDFLDILLEHTILYSVESLRERFHTQHTQTQLASSAKRRLRTSLPLIKANVIKVTTHERLRVFYMSDSPFLSVCFCPHTFCTSGILFTFCSKINICKPRNGCSTLTCLTSSHSKPTPVTPHATDARHNTVEAPLPMGYTTQTKKSVAVSTLTMWVVWLALFYLDLFTTEQIDRDILLGQYSAIHLWAFVGTAGVLGFILCLFLCFFELSGLDCYHSWTQCLCSTFFFYINICTITFFPPFSKFRELKLAEDGLIGDRPYSIDCMNSTTPSKLTLPANHSYFTLEDPEWTVDWNSRRTAIREHSLWPRTVAPIVYNGPVVGCQFDPLLWAVCVVQFPSMEACGFNESETGAYTSMRRFHSIHYIDTEEKNELKKVGDADYMVEFNSPTMAEVMGIVSQTKEEKARLWLISLVWFAGSTFLVVICVNCHYAREVRVPKFEVRETKNATCSVPSSEDHEMQVCKQHSLCHLTSPDITTGCRSFVRKLHCATST